MTTATPTTTATPATEGPTAVRPGTDGPTRPWSTVLVGTGGAPTGADRIVAAFRHDDGTVTIPLDSERPANKPLLRRRWLWLRWTQPIEAACVYTVIGVTPADPETRRAMAAQLSAPLPDTTVQLHLRPA